MPLGAPAAVTNIPEALSSPARNTYTFLHETARHNICHGETAFFTQLVEPARHNEKHFGASSHNWSLASTHSRAVAASNIEIAFCKNAKVLPPIAIFQFVTVIWLTPGFRTSASNLLLKDLLQTLLTASLVPCAVLCQHQFRQRTCLKPNALIECQQSCRKFAEPLLISLLAFLITSLRPLLSSIQQLSQTLLVSDDHRLRETEFPVALHLYLSHFVPKVFFLLSKPDPANSTGSQPGGEKKQTRDVTSIVWPCAQVTRRRCHTVPVALMLLGIVHQILWPVASPPYFSYTKMRILNVYGRFSTW